MRRPSVSALTKRLRIYHHEDILGIYVRRFGVVSNTSPTGPYRWFADPHGHWLEQVWRLHQASGIGRPGEWLLTLPNDPNELKLGPWRTIKELDRVLRHWRKWEIP